MKVMYLLFTLLLTTTMALLPAEGPKADPFSFLYEGNLEKALEQDQTLVDRTDELGNHPLQRAALEGNKEVIRLLLEHNVHVDQKGHIGNTALHWAVTVGNDEIVTMLLRSGADANAQNENGDTPLHTTAKYSLACYREIALILLEHGALISIPDEDGDTPLEVAQSCHNDFMINVFGHWPQVVSQYSTAKLAFCCASHPRLGAQSPANALPQCLVCDIVQHLRREHFASTNYRLPQPPAQSFFRTANSLLANRYVELAGATGLIAAFGLLRLLHR